MVKQSKDEPLPTGPVPHCRPGEHAHDGKPRPPVSPQALERASRLFRAMGEPPRLRILELLLERAWCVGEIVAAVNEKFSTVSQRLRVLRSEGVVGRRREGTHVFYTLADDHVADLVRNALAHAAELEAGRHFSLDPTDPEGDE